MSPFRTGLLLGWSLARIELPPVFILVQKLASPVQTALPLDLNPAQIEHPLGFPLVVRPMSLAQI